MSANPVVQLPYSSPLWFEIKTNLQKVSDNRYDICDLISLLDYVEHLVNLRQPSYPMLQLLPSRETFVGLGNYLCFHVGKELREYLISCLIPWMINLTIADNINATLPLLCSKAFEEFAVVLSRRCVASLVSASFFCLLPSTQTQNFLLNDVNFTYFFRGIKQERCGQVEKLDAIFEYFAHLQRLCCSTDTVDDAVGDTGLRITRRSLQANMQLLSRERLVATLHRHSLPLALVDHSLGKEAIAEKFGLPLVDFTNGYVGGSTLRTSEYPIFFRYPETLAAVAFCYRLEGAEALWIDNYLGPFGQRSNEVRRQRRLVLVNSTRFPAWASELQYSEACIVGDIVKVVAGLFNLELDSDQVKSCSQLMPFSDEWWANQPPGIPEHSTEKLFLPAVQVSRPVERPSCLEAFSIAALAKEMTHSILDCVVNSTIVFSKDRQIKLSKARHGKRQTCLFASQRPATTTPTYTANDEVSVRGNLNDVASTLSTGIISEAKNEAFKQMESIDRLATSMTQSIMRHCMASSPTRSGPVEHRLLPLRVNTSLATKPKRPSWFTPHSGFRQVREVTSYRHGLIAFAVSLASRCILRAILQLRDGHHAPKKHHLASSSQEKQVSSSLPVAPSVTSFVSAAPSDNGGDVQISFVVQWIAAAIASSSQPAAGQSSYLSSIVFTTNGHADIQQLHTIVASVELAGWSAGHLLQALLDYSDYRSKLLEVEPQEKKSFMGTAGLSSSSATKVLSFFEYLLSRFPSSVNDKDFIPFIC